MNNLRIFLSLKSKKFKNIEAQWQVKYSYKRCIQTEQVNLQKILHFYDDDDDDDDDYYYYFSPPGKVL